MSFSGYVTLRQKGHAMFHLDEFDEDYLIPFPVCKVKGFLAGRLYPELSGTYHIVSSSGFVSEINFSGEGFFSGVRNSFQARLYRSEDKSKTPLYTASGQWSNQFKIYNAADGNEIFICNPESDPVAPPHIPDVADQDPWESRRAWGPVLEAIKQEDIQRVIKEKSKLEEAQRLMRKEEAARGIRWKPKFFSSRTDDPLFTQLAGHTGQLLSAERTNGVWRFNTDNTASITKPYYGDLTPFG